MTASAAAQACVEVGSGIGKVASFGQEVGFTLAARRHSVNMTII